MNPQDIFIIVAMAVFIFTFLHKPAREEALFTKEYREYETPEFLAKCWYDKKCIGECKDCGGRDSPTVMMSDRGPIRCKWCLELEYILVHLDKHGSRRTVRREPQREDVIM